MGKMIFIVAGLILFSFFESSLANAQSISFCDKMFGEVSYIRLIPQNSAKYGVSGYGDDAVLVIKPTEVRPTAFFCWKQIGESKVCPKSLRKKSIIDAGDVCVSDDFDIRELCKDNIKAVVHKKFIKTICK